MVNCKPTLDNFDIFETKLMNKKNEEMDALKLTFISYYKEGYGNISYACRETRIGRQTFYNWRDTDPKFREAIKFVMEERKDVVESKLMENINAGMERSIIFFLERCAKDRGYAKDETEKTDPFEGVKFTPREAQYLKDNCNIIVDPENIQQYENG